MWASLGTVQLLLFGCLSVGCSEANEPHIYAIVEEGFNAMLNSTVHGPPKKQAIVITGN